MADVQRIQDEIIRAVQLDDFPRARALIASIVVLSDKAEQHKRLYEEQLEANRRLTEKIEGMLEPPLTQVVVLGQCPDDQQSVIVGMGSQRMEVRIAPDTSLDPELLQPGAEAWLNQERQLVKVRDSYSRGEAGEVISILEDGRVEMRSHGNEEVVVAPTEALREEGLRIGDRLRFDRGLAVAFEKLPTVETKDLELESVPDVRYEDIGGLDDKLAEIREAIEFPYLYNHLFRRYNLERPKGILLYGPPGCGKTMVAKAIANNLTAEITRNLRQIIAALELFLQLRDAAASPLDLAERYRAWCREMSGQPQPETSEMPPHEAIETELLAFLDTRGIAVEQASAQLDEAHARLLAGSQAFFMSIKGPELLNKYVGETEHSIRRLFLQAKGRASISTPVIMFFDEIEALFRQRGSRVSSDMESTVVPQFLSEIDGVEGLNNVIIIGATNRQDLLDPAILRPGRLDVKIKVERPNLDAAQAIFSKHLLPSLPVDPTEIDQCGSAEQAVAEMIERATVLIYHADSSLNVSGAQLGGQARVFPWRDFISGAMIANIVSRAKKRALRREIEEHRPGIRWSDLHEAIIEEFEQSKDSLIATTLNMPEEGLNIEVRAARVSDLSLLNPWLQVIARPWEASL
jgi:proteasome-associated ATPase